MVPATGLIAFAHACGFADWFTLPRIRHLRSRYAPSTCSSCSPLRCGVRFPPARAVRVAQLFRLLGFAMQHVCVVRTGAMQLMSTCTAGYAPHRLAVAVRRVGCNSCESGGCSSCSLNPRLKPTTHRSHPAVAPARPPLTTNQSPRTIPPPLHAGRRDLCAPQPNAPLTPEPSQR